LPAVAGAGSYSPYKTPLVRRGFVYCAGLCDAGRFALFSLLSAAAVPVCFPGARRAHG